VKPQGLVRLEGLGKLKVKKKTITSSGLEPSTFQLVTYTTSDCVWDLETEKEANAKEGL
jgi:hypothetical protein